MKKPYYILGLLFLYFTFLVACEDEGEKAEKELQNKFSGGGERTWKMTAFTKNGKDSYFDCHKDDEWVFNANGNLTITTNDFCPQDVNDPFNNRNQTDYTWFATGETLDIESAGKRVEVFKVESITNEEFLIRIIKGFDNPVTGDTDTTYIWTYQRQ